MTSCLSAALRDGIIMTRLIWRLLCELEQKKKPAADFEWQRFSRTSDSTRNLLLTQHSSSKVLRFHHLAKADIALSPIFLNTNDLLIFHLLQTLVLNMCPVLCLLAVESARLQDKLFLRRWGKWHESFVLCERERANYNHVENSCWWWEEYTNSKILCFPTFHTFSFIFCWLLLLCFSCFPWAFMFILNFTNYRSPDQTTRTKPQNSHRINSFSLSLSNIVVIVMKKKSSGGFYSNEVTHKNSRIKKKELRTRKFSISAVLKRRRREAGLNNMWNRNIFCTSNISHCAHTHISPTPPLH